VVDTLLGVIGILVSIFLFIVGYRQTVGAKKERVAACNQALEKILIRRIVLESHIPSAADVERLIEGKARDYRVRPADLLSVAQTLNNVYTRVTESDLIPADERQRIVERILPALTESETEAEDGPEPGVRGDRAAGVALLAVGASLLGALVNLLPTLINLRGLNWGVLKDLIQTVGVSLLVISVLAVFQRFRASQEDPPTRAGERDLASEFEKEVAHRLRRRGVSVEAVPPHRPGDFVVGKHGRKFLLEVKLWPRQVPSAQLEELAERLSRAASGLDAEEAIIVTKNARVGNASTLRARGVKVMTSEELIAYLTRRPDRDAG
jgi:hypothetical protein